MLLFPYGQQVPCVPLPVIGTLLWLRVPYAVDARAHLLGIIGGYRVVACDARGYEVEREW